MRGRWVGGWLAAAVVVFVVVGSAAPEALKAAHVSWPSWLVAGVVAAIPALVGVVKPMADAYAQVWAKRPARLAELVQRREELMESVVGSRGDLPGVREVTDRARLGIHPAIPLPADADPGLSRDLPTYVPRDVDADLRTWITAHQHTGGFVLLVGPAAAGKTRCLYQALFDTVPNWRLFLPATGEEVNEFAAIGADLSRTVVWLNDIERLVGTHGLTVTTVRRLLSDRARPVLLVGTIWPDDFDRLTREPSNDGQDLRSDIREILRRWPDRVFDLMPEFSASEQERLRELARHDPRLAEANRLEDAHVAQTLAAAPELIRRWRNPPDPYSAAVITAAVTARRCGHYEPLPSSILEPLAVNALTPAQRAAAKPDWFPAALASAREPVRGQAAPLTQQAYTVGVIEGDRVSDVLVQYASTDAEAPAHIIPDNTWHLLVTHATPVNCFGIGITAYVDERLGVAEHAWSKAADAGNIMVIFLLGLLLEQRGELEEAETWWRRAVDAGDTDAMLGLGALLEQRGEVQEAETWWRRAAEAGHTKAMLILGGRSKRRGDLEEAETWWRRGAEAGDTDAMAGLGALLQQRGEVQEAETWWRRAVDAGDTDAMLGLGALLQQRGEVQEAETWWRRAVDAGSTDAMAGLGVLLEQRGELEEAQTWWRRAAEAGYTKAMLMLGLRSERRGELKEAETWYQRAVDAGSTDAMDNLQRLLEQRGE